MCTDWLDMHEEFWQIEAAEEAEEKEHQEVNEEEESDDEITGLISDNNESEDRFFRREARTADVEGLSPLFTSSNPRSRGLDVSRSGAARRQELLAKRSS